jgi:transcriptional regulator with XRE-family HTH domain
VGDGRRTPHGSRGSARYFGAITGYTLKLIRESLRLTQVQLAERLMVDLSTVQGWETGRRPLISLRTGDFARLRVRLAQLGAPAHLFTVLIESVDADLLVADAVESGARVSDPELHPLGAFVHRRDLTNLLTWPLTGVLPSQLRDIPRTSRPHGPVATHPVLSTEERIRFFDHLLITADAHRDDDHALLRRQAIYLLSFDDRPSSKEWLFTEQRRAIRSVGHTDHPAAAWVAARSSVTALARRGDQEPLRAFVDTLLDSPKQEIANLNYWAYWVGELGQGHRDDSFMTSVSAARDWSGSHLIEHLLQRLKPNSDHAELNIHSLWALLSERPTLLVNTDLRALVQLRIEETMDSPDLTARARQELVSVAYAVRLADR